jgi:hypothetical protein
VWHTVTLTEDDVNYLVIVNQSSDSEEEPEEEVYTPDKNVWFDLFDRNSNGVVTRQEWVATFMTSNL